MKKTLFIISLRYPLINAINIKLNELHDKASDIILDDTIRNDSYQLAENLRNSQIFDNVFFTNPDGYNGLKKFFQNFNINNSFIKACYGSYKNLKLKDLYKTNQKTYLNNVVISGGKIDLSLYDNVYICSQTKISWICLNHLIDNNQISNINLIEEGVRDYYSNKVICNYNALYPNKKIIVHLYEPDLVIYNKIHDNIILTNISKISTKNTYFINKINQVFNYNSTCNFDNKIIFFEQVSEPMPNYLNNKILKILFYNAYNKHLKEHHYYLDKLNILNNLISILMKFNIINNFIIKLHPRTKKGISSNYSQFILGDKKNNHTIPWEVYCMNQKFKNNLWITINSSSVLNKILCFQEKSNIKFIFLYKCSKYHFIKTSNLEKFYKNFSKKYNEYMIIPKNFSELESSFKNIGF